LQQAQHFFQYLISDFHMPL